MCFSENILQLIFLSNFNGHILFCIILYNGFLISIVDNFNSYYMMWMLFIIFKNYRTFYSISSSLNAHALKKNNKKKKNTKLQIVIIIQRMSLQCICKTTFISYVHCSTIIFSLCWFFSPSVYLPLVLLDGKHRWC